MTEAEATMSALARSDDDPMHEEMMNLADSDAPPEVIKRGEFRDADSFHEGSGTATVWDLERDGFVLRLDDFRVTNGPDLRVILAEHADPDGRSDVHDDGYFELAKLKGNIGNQNYEIPLDVDIEQYGSVVIYCKPFQVIFAVAPLSAPSAMPSP